MESLAYIQSEQRIGEKGLKESRLVPLGDMHAFYVGKIPELGMLHRVQDLIGWGRKDSTYSKAYIQAALVYAVSSSVGKGPIHFVVGTELQTFCNGKFAMDGYLTLEEEKRFVLQTGMELGVQSQSIKVTSFGEEHPELFAALAVNREPDTGQVNLDRLFQSQPPELTAACNALDIAHYLYQGVLQSPALREAFQALVPNKLKTAREHPKNSFCTVDAYGLFELAIRLTDILRGRYVHGGVDRQIKYNQILIDLVRGEKGKYGSVAILSHLFTLLNGKSFQALNVDKSKNPFEEKKILERNKARLRIAWILGFNFFVGAGIVYHQQNTQDDRHFADAVQKVGQGVDCPNILNFDLLEQSQQTSRSIKLTLLLRYGLWGSDSEVIHDFFMEDVLRSPSACSILSDDQVRANNFDQFLQEHPFLLFGQEK